MRKQLFIALIVVLFVGVGAFSAYSVMPKNKQSPDVAKLDKLTLALDWTPNTNHTGLYVAQAEGWYEEEGIELEILPYSTASTPDALVGNNKADIGVSFTESIVTSSATDSPVTSIAAILPTNTSSIAVREDSGIKSLKDLDGKLFGGYGTAYEKPVMKTAITNDGGKGDFETVVVQTGLLESLESEEVDFVWIYDGWDKIKAEQDGFKIKTFPLKDQSIPDYYTPNLISSDATINKKKEALKRFMIATQKGYEFAAENPEDAAKKLISQVDKEFLPNEKLVIESQKYLANIYSDSDKPWGFQDKKMWQDYPNFMLKNKAIVNAEGKPITSIDNQSLYTNKLLP
ncbi:ABC transporter substrate-binding protein [Candidatus Saccharibacteria bacterium]|nr:ABC transporter substrate-binding protein [Candidatus Saccharibacteria bacterium]